MAENTVVRMGENSPEKVALDLMELVAKVENKEFRTFSLNNNTAADRKWILDTYAECLTAVKGDR